MSSEINHTGGQIEISLLGLQISLQWGYKGQSQWANRLIMETNQMLHFSLWSILLEFIEKVDNLLWILRLK